jgi:hypothetical protein
MKTKKIEKKLKLDKLTISNLSVNEQDTVKGGTFQTRLITLCLPTMCPSVPINMCC